MTLDYNKCYFCGSHNLDMDTNQSIYRDDICESPLSVEYGVVCKDCHQYQEYYVYGQVVPIYTKRKCKKIKKFVDFIEKRCIIDSVINKKEKNYDKSRIKK